MLWLVLLFLWLVIESYHYRSFHRKKSTWLRPIIPSSERTQWDRDYSPLLIDRDLHIKLSHQVVVGYHNMEKPHYKPIGLFLLLRGTHDLLYYGMKLVGWSCIVYRSVWFWERGTGPTLLFLHGFGFGPYVYWSLLHKLSQKYRVVAPQFPVLSFDGREDLFDLQEYARVVKDYFPENEPITIISNSFGTIIHHALLREITIHRITQQIYFEPVCFFPYAGQISVFVNMSLETCWSVPTWREFFLLFFSYLIISKDLAVLALCQQITNDPKWDGEKHLTTIPSTVIFSEQDRLIHVSKLAEYLRSKCRVIVLPNLCHGEACFSPELKLHLLLLNE